MNPSGYALSQVIGQCYFFNSEINVTAWIRPASALDHVLILGTIFADVFSLTGKLTFAECIIKWKFAVGERIAWN